MNINFQNIMATIFQTHTLAKYLFEQIQWKWQPKIRNPSFSKF